MIRKLQMKFVAVLMVMVTLMLCVIFGITLGTTRQSMDAAAMEVLQRNANNPGFPQLRGSESSGLPYFTLTRDMLGTIRVSGTVSSDTYTKEEIVGFWNQAVEAEEGIGIIEDYNLRYLRSGSRLNTRVAFVDITSQKLTMRGLVRSSVLIGILSLAALFAGAVLLSKWMVRPVEKAWEQQKQFVADASHELKTPLTVIMTSAELLQQGEGDLGQYAGGILTMSHQMRSLVNGLLELARVDNGAVKTAFINLNLSLLVSDSVLPFEPLYFEKGLMLESSVEEGIHIRGSVQHMQQVVEILLDNAMKYCAPDGQVRLKLQRQGNHALLTVSNSGAPIAPENLKNIFKRFYRVDQARSRDGSFGLGLSIAESIVTEHRGRIWAESSNGINRFCVQLPLL